MKKLLNILIFTLFSILLLTASSFALDYHSDEEGKYKVEIGFLEPETEYSIIIVAGDYTLKYTPEVTEENLIYINQAKSDADGYICFEDFIPLTESVGTVYISGSEALSQNGVLMNENGFGFIAGRIISYTARDEKDRIAVPYGFEEIDSGVFDSTNIKNVFIPSSIKKIANLAFKQGTRILFSPKANADITDYIQDGVKTFTAGDYNADGIVNKKDFDSVLLHFAKGITFDEEGQVDFNVYFDLNFDGTVTLLDVQILLYYLVGSITDFFS